MASRVSVDTGKNQLFSTYVVLAKDTSSNLMPGRFRLDSELTALHA
jgi:hypothetical protein